MSSPLSQYYNVGDEVQLVIDYGDVSMSTSFEVIQVDPNSGRITLQDPNNPWWKSKQETSNEQN